MLYQVDGMPTQRQEALQVRRSSNCNAIWVCDDFFIVTQPPDALNWVDSKRRKTISWPECQWFSNQMVAYNVVSTYKVAVFKYWNSKGRKTLTWPECQWLLTNTVGEILGRISGMWDTIFVFWTKHGAALYVCC